MNSTFELVHNNKSYTMTKLLCRYFSAFCGIESINLPKNIDDRIITSEDVDAFIKYCKLLANYYVNVIAPEFMSNTQQYESLVKICEYFGSTIDVVKIGTDAFTLTPGIVPKYKFYGVTILPIDNNNLSYSCALNYSRLNAHMMIVYCREYLQNTVYLKVKAVNTVIVIGKNPEIVMVSKCRNIVYISYGKNQINRSMKLYGRLSNDSQNFAYYHYTDTYIYRKKPLMPFIYNQDFVPDNNDNDDHNEYYRRYSSDSDDEEEFDNANRSYCRKSEDNLPYSVCKSEKTESEKYTKFTTQLCVPTDTIYEKPRKIPLNSKVLIGNVYYTDQNRNRIFIKCQHPELIEACRKYIENKNPYCFIQNLIV